MSILANSETFFSHGRLGVFYKIFLKELNRIDGKKNAWSKEGNVSFFLLYYYLFIDLVGEE